MSELKSVFQSLASIVDAEGSSGWKADQCLRVLSDLTPDDLAVGTLASAAQTFALLSIAESIGESDR